MVEPVFRLTTAGDNELRLRKCEGEILVVLPSKQFSPVYQGQWVVQPGTLEQFCSDLLVQCTIPVLELIDLIENGTTITFQLIGVDVFGRNVQSEPNAQLVYENTTEDLANTDFLLKLSPQKVVVSLPQSKHQSGYILTGELENKRDSCSPKQVASESISFNVESGNPGLPVGAVHVTSLGNGLSQLVIDEKDLDTFDLPFRFTITGKMGKKTDSIFIELLAKPDFQIFLNGGRITVIDPQETETLCLILQGQQRLDLFGITWRCSFREEGIESEVDCREHVSEDQESGCATIDLQKFESSGRYVISSFVARKRDSLSRTTSTWIDVRRGENGNGHKYEVLDFAFVTANRADSFFLG